ncbi:MAG: hypothetical protein CM15mP113_3010 [Pseudomonadota bacterium]|nr:MAG: hypothetical protein CM15mP113_3010 [Pseudomonadota bacterium]
MQIPHRLYIKSINQFLDAGIGVGIGTAEDLRDNETIFGYENGDLTKRIDLRITGVLSELVPITDIKLVNESENVFVKNIGEKIFNDGKIINKYTLILGFTTQVLDFKLIYPLVVLHSS